MKNDNFELENEIIYENLAHQHMTIRQVEESSGIPRSTVHHRVHRYFKNHEHSKYCEIVKVLDYNKQYRSLPRKCWKSYDAEREVMV